MRKTVIITGAGRGLGRAIALELAAAGYDLWLTYRSSEEQARSLEAEATGLGAACRLMKFDVSDQKACENTLGAALKEAPAPWGLVNNAGITSDGIFVRMSDEQWSTVLDTALDGFFHVTKPVAAAMMKARAGRIINISSVVGLTGNPGQVNYCAAKAGLIGATKALALELARRNVLVNCIAPGFIETDMTKGLDKENAVKQIPLGRLGQPKDIAAAVRFLLAEENSYITGQVISVNGGMY